MKTPKAGKDINVLTKTPDEIKKGLRACGISGCSLPMCPYHSVGNGSRCIPAMSKDALAYIAQLESRLAQIERERDAAVAGLKEAAKEGAVCSGCKHDVDFGLSCEEADFDCLHCNLPCACKTCDGNSNYEWRGVCEDDTKEAAHESDHL